jgi:hypothetical protein
MSRPVGTSVALSIPSEGDMTRLVLGVAILVVGGIVFWWCLPRNGIRHRLVDTEFEPYVAVAFCAAVALGCSLLLAGAIDQFG